MTKLPASVERKKKLWAAYPCTAADSVKAYKYLGSWQCSEKKNNWMSLYKKGCKLWDAVCLFGPTENRS